MKHHPQCPAVFGYRCDCVYGTEREHSSGSFRPEPELEYEPGGRETRAIVAETGITSICSLNSWAVSTLA